MKTAKRTPRVTKKMTRPGKKKTAKRKPRVTAREAAVSADCGLKSPRTQRRAAFQKALIKIRQCTGPQPYFN